MNKTNFRKLVAEDGTLILAGRNDENNEQLISQAGGDEDIFHTKEAGSPFVNIKGKATKLNVKTAALFCAKYSRDWKKNKWDVIVHRFKGRDIYKERGMKAGTFGVKKFKSIKIKKKEIEEF